MSKAKNGDRGARGAHGGTSSLVSTDSGEIASGGGRGVRVVSAMTAK